MMGKARITNRTKKLYDAIVGGLDSDEFCDSDHYYKCWSSEKYRRRCWSAYYFASKWKGRVGFHLHRLQLIVIQSGDAECAFMFARDIPGAKVKRLQKVVVNGGDPKIMRRFAREIDRADGKLLENAAIVEETMAL